MMKNNKSQATMEFLMTYGWAILAAIIVIGVFAYFGVFSPGKYVVEEPHFKFTKEECRNEYNVEILVKCIEMNRKDIGFCYDLVREEICEQVEVYEIEECGGSYLCKEKPGCCLKYYVDNNELTTEWLDEKCEKNCEGCGRYKCGDYIVEVK